MGRRKKTYSMELNLISKMEPGMAWRFPVEYPRGFMSKVYNLLDNHPYQRQFHVRIQTVPCSVIVTREPEPKTPTEKDYADED